MQTSRFSWIALVLCLCACLAEAGCAQARAPWKYDPEDEPITSQQLKQLIQSAAAKEQVAEVAITRASSSAQLLEEAALQYERLMKKHPDKVIFQSAYGFCYFVAHQVPRTSANSQRWKQRHESYDYYSSIIDLINDAVKRGDKIAFCQRVGGYMDRAPTGTGAGTRGIQRYKKAVELNPKYDIAWRNLANAYLRVDANENPQAALEAAEAAIRINPRSYRAQDYKAGAFFAQKRYKLAHASLQKAVYMLPPEQARAKHNQKLLALYKKLADSQR